MTARIAFSPLFFLWAPSGLEIKDKVDTKLTQHDLQVTLHPG